MTNKLFQKITNLARILCFRIWSESHLIIFLIFGILLFSQMCFVYLYHDDFGYVSLSYANLIPSVSGTSFTLSQLMEFLIAHYMTWGGRVLFIGLEILILRWGLLPFRLIQTLVIVGILYSIYLLLVRYFSSPMSKRLLALTLCCWFGLIPIEFHQNGTYWATASFVYVWPFVFAIFALVLHQHLDLLDIFNWKVFVLGILYFIIGFSQEQIGLLFIIVVVGITLLHVFQKRSRQILWVDLFALSLLLIGYLFLMIAPGNFERLHSPIYKSFLSLQLIEKVKINLPILLYINFGKYNQAFMLVWIFLCTAVTWSDMRKKVNPLLLYRFVFVACMGYSVLLIISLFPMISKLSDKIYHFDSLLVVLFWICFLVVACLATLLFSLNRRYNYLLFLFIGGLASEISMIISPSINYRTELIFLFPFFSVLSAMLVDVFQYHKKNILYYGILLSFVTFASLNFYIIFKGYQVNSWIMEQNNEVLIDSSLQISREGNHGQPIYLSKLPNDLYAGSMPYNPDTNYINYWIKEYYNIPADIELVWR